jgi:transglutaminase-like putative cysteine protease
MKLERWLQISLAALSLLGTTLLGLAEGNSLAALVMLIAAPAAVLFSDSLGWIRLTRPLANLGALAAVGYTFFDFLRHGTQNQLLAIANLLLYLQLVLLFQEKNLRIYWQLLVLSLLEVVVAGAMNLSFHFGFLLVVYMAIALAALALLSTIREARLWSPAPAQALDEVTPTKPLRPVAVIGLLTLVFATAFFYATPRIQGTQWIGPGGQRSRQVGFSRSVSLDEMGRILESNELALRASFYDPVNQTPYDIVGQTYFRGAVLTRYSEQVAGRWSSSSRRETRPLPWPPEGLVNLVTQEMWLEPTSTPTLFAISPAFRLNETPRDVVVDPKSGEIQRSYAPGFGSRQRWQYRLSTSALINGRAMPIIPDQPWPGAMRKPELYAEVRDCERFNRRRFPEIAAAAEQILRDADALDADRVRKAKLLENHFLQSGLYTYSLDFRFPRRPNVDPIEDFIARHRTGHCEYFATALVLMLRSQHIPARLVVGYKGGEFNGVGNYLLVRQNDAHAWVEVHLEPDEIDSLNIPGWHYRDSGGWYRLDPTPGSRDPEADGASVRAIWDQFLDYAEFIWSDYIQGMGTDRQRQAAYEPVAANWREWTAKWLDFRLWPRRFAEVMRWMHARLLANPFAYAALVALFALVAWLFRRSWTARVRQWWADRHRLLGNAWQALTAFMRFGRPTSVRSSVAFYDRFERLLARAGQVRPPGVTPREWLTQLVSQIPQQLDNHDGNSDGNSRSSPAFTVAATSIVEAFYRARYHQAPPQKPELEQLEQSLAIVAEYLQPRGAAANSRRG